VGYNNFVMVRDGPAIELAVRPDPLERVTVVGDHIVGLTGRNELRSWRISDIVPFRFALDRSAKLLEVGDRHVWSARFTGQPGDGLSRRDLSTGTVRTWIAGAATRLVCELGDQALLAIDAEIHLPRDQAMQLDVADVRSGAQHTLSHSALRYACAPSAGLVIEATGAELAVRRAP